METDPATRLVFLHHEKSGGIAFLRWLRSHFAPEECSVNPPGWADEGLQAQMVAGHMSSAVMDRIPGPYVSVTILREPVHRALSHYSWMLDDGPKGETSPAFLAEMAQYRSWTLQEYAVQARANRA